MPAESRSLQRPSAAGPHIPVALLLCLALAGCNPAADPTAPQNAAAPARSAFTAAAEAAAARIGADTIRRTVVEISDDRYAGRAPGTPGDVAARNYLAEQLADIGFAPGAADGGWEQPFDLMGVTARMPEIWTFAVGDAEFPARSLEDYVAASGVQTSVAALENAELVFVGYGIQAPEYGWDDYKGIDVSGKVLVMLNNDPDWDPALFEGNTRLYYGRWSYKYEIAAALGAAGAIIIHTAPSAGYPWQVVQSSWSGTQYELPDAGEPRIQIEAWLTEDAATRLLAAAGHDLAALVESARSLDFAPVELNVSTTLRMPVEVSATSTANVIGILPGSDAALADEYVIYTAHHDHLGVGDPNPNGDPNDRIYNGAVDNASGVGMLMAIGEAYAALKPAPRRSIMVLFVGAEEQGLLGSAWYASNPTVQPGRIAANVNLDSANIWGRSRDLAFIGYGKSTLDAVAERVTEYQGRILEGDEFPDRGYYYRSDQFSFAKIGVPAFYLHGGTDIVGRPEGWGVERVDEYTDLHYHQPSDEYDASWNFDGIVEDAQFSFWAGLIVAESDSLPAWNAGDEFEAARLAALAELR